MTNAIHVVHVNRCSGPLVYIGRRYGGRTASPLANPWKVYDELDRVEAIRRYEQWLRSELAEHPNGPAGQEIQRLAAMHRAGETIALACWCAPKACHGDVVAEIVRTVAKVVPV